MHVETTECGVRPLSCHALPIGVDHTRDAELIFGSLAAKRHHYVRRLIVLDVRLLQNERPVHRLFCKNHSSEIRLLQKFDQAARYYLVVSDDIEKNATAVSGQHDVSRFWFSVEFCRRGESRLV